MLLRIPINGVLRSRASRSLWVGVMLVAGSCQQFQGSPEALPARLSSPAPSAKGPQSSAPDLTAAPRVRFPGLAGLSILLPEGFVLKTESGATPEIHHLWRDKPVPLEREVSLSIVIAPIGFPQCSESGRKLPPRTPDWEAPWRTCGTSVPGVQARESFLPLPDGRIVQVAVVGAAGEEAEVLQAIGETLRLD